MWFGGPKDIQRNRELRGRGRAVPISPSISAITVTTVPVLDQRRVGSIVSRRLEVNNSPLPFRFFDSQDTLFRERRRRNRLSVGTYGGGGSGLVIRRWD